MNRKLRNSLLAMASSASLLLVTVVVAGPGPSPLPIPVHAQDSGHPVPAAARAGFRHGVAMPFFSFRPRS